MLIIEVFTTSVNYWLPQERLKVHSCISNVNGILIHPLSML